MVHKNKKLNIIPGTTYLFEPLRDEVVCEYVTPATAHTPAAERVATFKFKSVVAAFHAIPFTLPLALCDKYLAEMPQAPEA